MKSPARSLHSSLPWTCQLLSLAFAATSIPIHNFTQLITHDGTSNATFQQRYQIDTSHFQAGGPILLFQGAETVLGVEANPLQLFDFYDDAAELGGISATIEHRFFGTSFPAGFDASAAAYAPLTLDNVLSDSVSFVEWIRSNVSGAENSPVFIESGSYGGFLVAMARIRHPDTFFGTFVSSGPVSSFGPSPNNTDRFEIYDWMSNVYYDLSSDAADKIKSAMALLDECSQNGTCSTEIDFGLCDPQPTETQYRTMYSAILDLYKRVPQFSYPVDVALQANPLLKLVNLTEEANTTGEVLRAPIQVANWATTDLSQCANWTSSNASFGLEAQKTGSFGWIQCNYFMVNQYSIGENNMLPVTNATGRVEICNYPEWAGPMSNWTNDEWINWYGFSNQQLSQMQRMVFIGGQYDPISGDSLPDLPESPDRNAPRSLIVEGLGHTSDVFGQALIPRGMNANSDMIRDTKLEYLKEWIETYRASSNSSNGTLTIPTPSASTTSTSTLTPIVTSGGKSQLPSWLWLDLIGAGLTCCNFYA